MQEIKQEDRVRMQGFTFRGINIHGSDYGLSFICSKH